MRSMGTKPLCIAVYVFGKYQKYIPFYVYSILRSYPEYFVKIFLDRELEKPVAEGLSLVSKNLSNMFEVHTESFTDINFREKEDRKCMRWLIPENAFTEFDNAYIGDVDFLIVREKTPLHVMHLRHCQKTGLPFSNRVREGNYRLTGLHFFKVTPYYEKMGCLISYYRDNLIEITKVLDEVFLATGGRHRSDEAFLYHIVNKGVGLHKLLSYNNFRPHHGFHLGLLRGGEFNEEFFSKGQEDPSFLLPEQRTFKEQLRSFYLDPLFEELFSFLPINEISLLGNIVFENSPPEYIRRKQEKSFVPRNLLPLLSKARSYAGKCKMAFRYQILKRINK